MTALPQRFPAKKISSRRLMTLAEKARAAHAATESAAEAHADPTPAPPSAPRESMRIGGFSLLELSAIAATLLVGVLLAAKWRTHAPPARTAEKTQAVPDEEKSGRALVAEEGVTPPEEKKTEAPQPPDAPKQVPPEQPPPDPKAGKEPVDNVRQKLADTKLTFEFVDTPLSEALAFLQARTRVPIKLEAGRQEAQTAVSLKVTDMKAELAIEWLAKLAGMEFEVQAAGVRIFQGAVPEPVYVEKTYDLAACLIENRKPEHVVALLKESILPNSWTPNGKADVVLKGNKAIVTHTEDAQRHIKALLISLRLPDRIRTGMGLKAEDVTWALEHLGSDDVELREAAHNALLGTVEEHTPRIAEALKQAKDPEVLARLKRILQAHEDRMVVVKALTEQAPAVGIGANRFGERRAAALKLYGGDKETEKAANLSLKWLAAHQEADGHWDCQKYGGKPADTALTGLCLLAFLGAGHTKEAGDYKNHVRRAVEWLISIQRDDGSLYRKGETHGIGYHHGIAGLALVEAAGMLREKNVIVAAQRAVDYSVKVHQHAGGGFRYSAGEKGDLSVSAWFIAQLKVAKSAGLKVPASSIDGIINFLDQVEEKTAHGGHRYGYMAPGHAIRTTFIGCYSRMTLGWKREDVKDGVTYALNQGGLPKWDDKGAFVDLYHWYYGSLACFQQGGDAWKSWNAALKKELVEHQRKGGDEDGSFDPVGAYAEYVGRAGQTALAALCLEVYYRYPNLYEK